MNVEEELLAIVRRKTANEIGAGTKLTDAGLDSLDVIEIAFDIEDQFKIQLPQMAGEMMTFTYGDLCRLVEQQLAAKPDAAVIARGGD